MDRRSLLKSLPIWGAAPYLAPLVARAEAETHGRKPMRFVFLLEGNGLWPEHVMPRGFKRQEMKNPRGGDHHFQTTNGADTLTNMSLGGPDGLLPEALSPLEKYIKRVTLLTGLSGRVAGGGHGCGYGALGAYPAVAGPKDITIDAALAKTTPAIRQLVGLGFLHDPATAPPMFQGYSAYGPNQKVSFIQDPLLAHKVLFGKVIGGDPRGEVGAQSIILDALAEDIRKLQPHLPGEEGRKLERAADAFSTIRKRQSRLGEINPARIPATRPDFHGSKEETTRMKAHVELAATALITGLTNTVTLCSGVGYPTWKGLGLTLDTHEIGHRANDPAAQAMRVKIRQFNAGLIARLVEALEAVPEGTGTLMDNTLIIYLSDSAETHHCVCMEWPMVLVGNLGGRLKTGGRFINLPKYGAKGHATVAQFYTALLHAAGAPVNHFGMKDRFLIEAGLDQRDPWGVLLS
ncbi:MAG: DUF1552 domain-containing protein [Planctomycetia bacterium]|nr:DUF1552 domain-containing protein [Planctomycetia bacterium]